MTPQEVAAWYAGPMAAMRQAAGKPAGGRGPVPFAEFVRKYEAVGVQKTHAEWQAAYRRHTGASGDG